MIDFEKTIKNFSGEDQDYELWLLLSWARQAVYRTREKELLRYRLSPEHARVLVILNRSEETATPASLARLMLVEPHTMSALINRMEKRGLVKKTRDLERRNMVRVSITEEGKKALKYIIKLRPIHRIIGNFGEREKQQLRSLLLKMIKVATEELGLNRDNLPPSE